MKRLPEISMFEMRFHGRGGQGAVLASKILAKALAEEGRHVKAIPSFGFERRGAPVTAYLRFSDNPIRQTTNIYNPNCVVCLDPTLPQSVDIFERIQSGGIWIQSTKKSVDRLAFPGEVTTIGLCDAFGIALKIFGRTIVNSTMLGAFSRTTGLVTLDSLYNAMATVAFRDAALEKNILACKTGYEQCRVIHNGEGTLDEKTG